MQENKLNQQAGETLDAVKGLKRLKTFQLLWCNRHYWGKSLMCVTFIAPKCTHTHRSCHEIDKRTNTTLMFDFHYRITFFLPQTHEHTQGKKKLIHFHFQTHKQTHARTHSSLALCLERQQSDKTDWAPDSNVSLNLIKRTLEGGKEDSCLSQTEGERDRQFWDLHDGDKRLLLQFWKV